MVDQHTLDAEQVDMRKMLLRGRIKAAIILTLVNDRNIYTSHTVLHDGDNESFIVDGQIDLPKLCDEIAKVVEVMP